ncbi:MAG TPA: trypsin-like serine protease, partial [Rhodobacterales bacterium]|nr:trypsin-like serine protease [Rhodobacterales bacterium]
MFRFARRFACVMALALGQLPGLAVAEAKVPESVVEMQLSFAPVVAQSAPAVVSVYATFAARQGGLFANDPIFSEFFRSFGAAPEGQNALGAGVLVGDGLIVTNYHVVRDAETIRVVLADRREYGASEVLADEQSDLVVLRLQGADMQDLPALPIGDSDTLAVGDLVLAIGNPFGVGLSVSSGIISGLARARRESGGLGNAKFFLQTDAPINPGNSGGALVNMRGELVGINTLIVTRSGGSNGLGFAIPVNIVRQVVAQARAGNS